MQRMAPIQLHRNVPVFRWSGGAAHFAFWLSTAQLIAAIGRLLCDPIADVRDSELEWLNWVGIGNSAAMAGIGQKRSLTGTMPKVRLQIRKRTFEPIAAAQNDLFLGYVSFEISKRKKLAGSDFVAY